MKRNPPSGEITVAAVLAYARDLRQQADIAKARDPHCELYRPSNDVARKVAAQHGPAKALEVLAARARKAEVAHQEDEQRSENSRARLVAHQLVAAGERRVDRDQMTIGQRLDAALRTITITADGPTARIDGDRVSESRTGGAAPPSRRDRRRQTLLEDVRIAVERIEDEAEHGRRRMVELEAA